MQGRCVQVIARLTSPASGPTTAGSSELYKEMDICFLWPEL